MGEDEITKLGPSLGSYWVREDHYEALRFFTALLLAVSINRAANLEALETFVKDLKRASKA